MYGKRFTGYDMYDGIGKYSIFQRNYMLLQRFKG